MKVLLILLLASSVHAQDVHQSQEIVESTPIESFSSKAEGWPKDTIDQDVLDVQGSSLYDALNKYPGIQTQGEASSGSPTIRIRGSGSSARTLLLFDGTPVNAQDGIGANPLLLPTELVEDVDILKGPSSLFYGSDAVGGAINLRPRKFLRPTIRAGYESSNKPSLFLGTPFLNSEKHSLQATAYADDSEGNFEYEDPTLGKSKRKNNNRKKQRYSLLGENKFSYTTLSHHFIYAHEEGKSPGQTHAPNIIDFDRNAFLGALHVNQKINPSWNANYKISHTIADNDTTEAGTTTNWLATKTSHSLSSDYQITNYNNLEVFTDFVRDDFNSELLATGKLHDEHFEHGLIFKSQVSDNEFLLAGVRFFPDQNEVIKNILLKQETRDYTLWASYSEGLRIPHFSQEFDTAFTTGNPNLKPEQSNQIEVGAETQYQKIKFKLSGYMIEYKDFIQYFTTPAPYSFENVQSVTTKGAEIQASTDYKIYHALASYALMKSVNDQTDERMPLAPTSQAYAVVGAQLAAFIFELHNTYWSGYKLDNGANEDDWWTTDVTLRTSGFIDWNFKAGVLNLLGVERTFSNGFPEPKTQYFVFAEKSF